jgi:hypothetical protein
MLKGKEEEEDHKRDGWIRLRAVGVCVEDVENRDSEGLEQGCPISNSGDKGEVEEVKEYWI